MVDLVTFGEAMVRLSPPDKMRLEQTHILDVNVGGGEYNVAVGAARLGLSASFVTRLPKNPLGRMIVNKAREHGVDTSQVVWCEGERTGLYFVEFGAKPRASTVYYDRMDSAICNIEPGMVNWDDLFRSAKVFFVSGITPALSPNAAAAVKEAVQKAREYDVTICMDLNYRARLWTEAEAQQCLTELMEFTDILITTQEDARRIFKINGSGNDEIVRKLHAQFGFKVVAITIRENPRVWLNHWSAIVLYEEKIYQAPTYEIEIVDRIGGGDAFAAGFLTGYLEGRITYGVKLGTAYSAIKQTIPGDLNWVTREEVDDLIKGGENLRMVR